MDRRKLVVGLAAGLLLAVLSRSAAAQEFRPLPGSERSVELFQGGRDRDMEGSVSLQGRYSIPLGTVDPDIPADYGDLFKGGLGFSVEGTLLFRVAPKWRLGPYLSIGWDSYDGKSDTDDLGDTLKPDAMDLTSVLVGARAILDLGPQAQLDLHMGFGATHYGAVDGVFTTGGVPLDVVVFKSSTKFAFDIGTRFNFLAGPAFFDVGIDIRSQGAPDNGDFLFDSGTLVTFGIEFGAGIRF